MVSFCKDTPSALSLNAAVEFSHRLFAHMSEDSEAKEPLCHYYDIGDEATKAGGVSMKILHDCCEGQRSPRWMVNASNAALFVGTPVFKSIVDLSTQALAGAASRECRRNAAAISVVGGSAGATVGAATGGVVGTLGGGVVGVIIGIVPAVFTAGLSLPVGALIGSGIGGATGVAVGTSTGFLGVGGFSGCAALIYQGRHLLKAAERTDPSGCTGGGEADAQAEGSGESSAQGPASPEAAAAEPESPELRPQAATAGTGATETFVRLISSSDSESDCDSSSSCCMMLPDPVADD